MICSCGNCEDSKSFRIISKKSLSPSPETPILPSFSEFISFTFRSQLSAHHDFKTFRGGSLPKLQDSSKEDPRRISWQRSPQLTNTNKATNGGLDLVGGNWKENRTKSFLESRVGKTKSSPEMLIISLTPKFNQTFSTTSGGFQTVAASPAYKTASNQENPLEERLPRDKGSSSSKRSYYCSYCPLYFTFQKHLISHVKERHERKKPFGCPRNGCRQRFGGLGDVNRHVKTVHDGEKRFLCHLCDRCFSRRTGLKRHLVHLHKDQQ